MRQPLVTGLSAVAETPGMTSFLCKGMKSLRSVSVCRFRMNNSLNPAWFNRSHVPALRDDLLRTEMLCS